MINNISRLKVNLKNYSYEILIGYGLLAKTGEILCSFFHPQKVFIVTNPTIQNLWGKDLEGSLLRSGFQPIWGIVPDGEEYKTMEQAIKLLDQAVQHQLERQTPILAFGGGVIGDLAGLVAALYLRGIPLIQIPTTLLAQVDSSVGGKVAVNHRNGKNLLGCFYHPHVVIADPGVLSTLPLRELRNGLAEVIKYGMIWDAELFRFVEKNIIRLLSLEYNLLHEIIKNSCAIKAKIVELDEKEHNLRTLLNYGHTIGHALETETSYRYFRHGEAVAIGMVGAAALAVELGLISENIAEQQKKLLQQTGLPTEYPSTLSPERIYKALFYDKKVVNNELRFVLPTQIGKAIISKNVAENLIIKVLNELHEK